ncbi:MAG TPA: triphosphoribosyl-dephospho-CoA synthase [Methylophaga aminisulfidivorans]|jgi:triphosphoribosyl-dephospho-CoA synthase|uniref:Triphosphoribosyl-dephospho-CoA synthetase n=1 Tax=Methylophaga aminisulfidivorans MP TaxID=1026882 RepID=F5SXZ7_9GAMM|nr:MULTISPECIES: triphosphoribosyl-dephospho-CoA synthase [Methylophaga]EGL54065.1 triphosphoribosyl-dephospho-CoA synthetase [Methylophaga aminisulfidivorans MP]HIC47506.1 triphosphoribosyl-dephospho-CoA synthase [Methylophaga sp.]HIM38364.1 triphosphoribosyl-dephospho-CoA synthase [Methylophaga aminisulfidivorans]
MLSESDIKDAVFWACQQEVLAPKPGNVNVISDGHNMVVEDFIKSARAIAPIMAKTGLTVGERILQSVQATRQVVNCNTNLGIVLLFAPLCQAIQYCQSFDELPQRLQVVLSNLTVNDAIHCYEAIRLAEAGGLGKEDEHDISAVPTITLLEAMDLAKNRDQIAQQYVNNFKTLWDLSLPALTKAINSGESVEWATAFAYLKLLSKALDSLISRKQSTALATKVSERAKQFVIQIEETGNLDTHFDALSLWDKELKEKAINPGTSADLIAATLLLHRFGRLLSFNEFQYHEAFSGRH